MPLRSKTLRAAGLLVVLLAVVLAPARVVPTAAAVVRSGSSMSKTVECGKWQPKGPPGFGLFAATWQMVAGVMTWLVLSAMALLIVWVRARVLDGLSSRWRTWRANSSGAGPVWSDMLCFLRRDLVPSHDSRGSFYNNNRGTFSRPRYLPWTGGSDVS